MMQTPPPSTPYWPDWLSLAVAALALVQPWLIALWKRLFQRGRLEVYETGVLEIGFSEFGPTVAVLGTIRCEGRDVFVERMSLKVIRLKDRAEHLFAWRAFRPHSVSSSPDGTVQFEVASSFLVSPSVPHRFNVFFASNDFQSTYRARVAALWERWKTYVDTERATVDPTGALPVRQLLDNPITEKALVDGYMRLPEPAEVHRVLNHDFFWREGDYSVQLSVHGARPERVFAATWQFTLEPADEARLRLNIIALLESGAGRKVQYSFAYPQYRKNRLPAA